MREKIYSNILILAIVTIILTTFSISQIYFSYHVKTEKSYIKNYGDSIYNIINSDNSKISELDDNSFRHVLINPHKEIIYDSYDYIEDKNITTVLNEVDTESTVLNTVTKGHDSPYNDTYYYSQVLDNGNIFRVSTEVDNLFYVIINILPSLLLIILLITLLSFIISVFVSNNVLRPINKIMDNVNLLQEDNSTWETVDIYDELLPLVRTIVDQGTRINSQLSSITEQKNILSTVISNMNDGIVFIKSNTEIITVNNSCIKLLNADLDMDYINRPFNNLNRDIKLNQKIDEALHKKDNSQFFLGVDDRHIYFSTTPVIYDEEVSGLIIFMMDYTEKYRIDTLRKDFASNVSHELKTPLTSINGYAEILSSGMVEGDDVIKFGSIIKSEGDRLLNLINSVINISKIENEESLKKFDEFNLYLSGQEIINRLEFLAERKNIKLTLYGNDTLVYADRNLLEEAIYNLVDNAIKYTKEGGFVNLYINRQNNQAVIKVEDNGIGIPEKSLSRIFERFYVVDASRNKETQSTGLGLSIVKHIVNYHDGIIKIDSKLNVGTTITIKI